MGFVGREGELSRLLAAVAGDARLVLVTGDAGVGKTRFVTEGMRRAARWRRGVGVCRCVRRCRCCRWRMRWVS